MPRTNRERILEQNQNTPPPPPRTLFLFGTPNLHTYYSPQPIPQIPPPPPKSFQSFNKKHPRGVFFKFGTPLYIKTPVCYILAWRQNAKGVSYPACLSRTNRAGSPFSLMGTDPVGFSASSSQLLSRYHSP